SSRRPRSGCVMPSLRHLPWIIVAVLVLLAAASIPSYFTFKAEREKEIAALTKQRDDLAAEKKDTDKHAKEIDDENTMLRAKVDGLQSDVKTHLANVSELKTQLDAAHVAAFTTLDPGEYVAKINKFYPGMAESDWAVVQTISPTTG